MFRIEGGRRHGISTLRPNVNGGDHKPVAKVNLFAIRKRLVSFEPGAVEKVGLKLGKPSRRVPNSRKRRYCAPNFWIQIGRRPPPVSTEEAIGAIERNRDHIH